MRNAGFYITVPHLYSSVSAFSAEGEPLTTTSRIVFHGTFQINQFNSQIFNSAFIQFLRITI